MYLEEHSKARNRAVVAVVCRVEAREDVARRHSPNCGIGQRRAGFSGDGPPASQGTTK